jgi:glycosyltransferase involved in cell wall biosynthesis
MSAHADEAVRRALPFGRAVVDDPTFDMTLSFDERCAKFARMLHDQLDSWVRRDDRLLLTTATQCEARAIVIWLSSMPPDRRPWTLIVWHSDRWNRYGSVEKARQLAEFALVKADLAKLDADTARHLVLASVTGELCEALRQILGVRVERAPIMLPGARLVAPRPRPAGRAPTVAVVGGSRPEKGSHRVADIVAESVRLGPLNFAIQIFNEALSEEELIKLRGTARFEGVNLVEGALEQGVYRQLICDADILLFPYDRLPYRIRLSSIFIEAATIGRPVVAPSLSWLGDRITAGDAAGVVYDGDQPQDIARALRTAADDLDQLSDKAQVLSPRWDGAMGTAAFLDWLESMLTLRSTPDR